MMWIAVILLCTLSYPSNGARMLGVLGSDSKSRYANIRNLADELVSRGHEVLLIVPSHLPFPPSKTVKHSAYDWPLEKDYLENTVSKCFSGFKWKAIRMPKIWEDFLITTCRAIIKHVKKRQEEFKSFDLLFGDSPPDCHVIIAEFLVLPRIDIKPAYAMRHRQMELGLVSYIPSIKSSNIGEMSFMGRFQNLFSFGSMKVWKIYHFTRLGELKAEFNITPERNFQESIHLAEMTLIMGHFALEYPQPLLPDTKLVGPLTVKPPSPLPRDLEQFISGAGEKGIILFSLGTLGDNILTKHQIDMLAEVFGRLEQRIIWRLKRHIPEGLSSNIKVLPWIPQNDLLAHNSTRAFISHTGHNSLYEAAFYGVPLVCVPIFFDQFSNCIQAQSVGMAIGVDVKTVTSDEIYQSIRRLLEEPSFKGNATSVSRLIRDNPRNFVQQAADWIEYAHRHRGTKHLKAEVYNLHWYQYYLLDVLVFLLTAIFASCFAIGMLFKLLWKTVTRQAKDIIHEKQD